MTYAEFLATMTVKSLNEIAKQMGLKGYSKLRKAALVTVLDNAIAEIFPVILDVETDAPQVRKIMVTVAPVTFSARDAMARVASARRPQIAAKPRTEVTPDTDTPSDLSELVEAYSLMRKTFRSARGATQVKIGNRLRSLSAEIKSLGGNMRTV